METEVTLFLEDNFQRGNEIQNKYMMTMEIEVKYLTFCCYWNYAFAYYEISLSPPDLQ